MVGSQLLHFTEQGAGSPLLLVHGLMVTGDMFDHVMAPFAAKHRVIVPDLRGHGRSRGLPPPYTVRRLSADLVTLLDHLNIPSAAVVGYSQGGAVAQEFAIAHPERCSRLVLCCTYAFNMSSLREKLEGHAAPWFIRLLGLKRFSKLVFSVGMGDVGAERRARLAGLISSQDDQLMLTAWREAMAFDSRSRLGEIRCPTLVLAGSQDTAVPMHHAKQLISGIRGSRLSVIDGANHGLIWSHTDKFLSRIDDFLAEPGQAVTAGGVHVQ